MSPLWCLGYQALDLTMEPIAGPIPKLAKCVFFICNLKTIFNNKMIHDNIIQMIPSHKFLYNKCMHALACVSTALRVTTAEAHHRFAPP